jgi:hypothetical protein
MNDAVVQSQSELEQVERRPEIRAVIGDGTCPQARDLTAREGDDLCRIVMVLTGEFRCQDRPGHYRPAADPAGASATPVSFPRRPIARPTPATATGREAGM